MSAPGTRWAWRRCTPSTTRARRSEAPRATTTPARITRRHGWPRRPLRTSTQAPQAPTLLTSTHAVTLFTLIQAVTLFTSTHAVTLLTSTHAVTLFTSTQAVTLFTSTHAVTLFTSTHAVTLFTSTHAITLLTSTHAVTLFTSTQDFACCGSCNTAVGAAATALYRNKHHPHFMDDTPCKTQCRGAVIRHPYLLETEGLFTVTQGWRPGRTFGESVGGNFEMDSFDWSNGI